MAIDSKKLLPPGRPDTPEGRVEQEGTPAGYVTVKQYNSLNKNILSVRDNLSAIANLLIQRGRQEEQEDVAEQRTLRVQEDSAKKGRKEDFIERTLKNALVKPIEAIQKQSKGVFGRLFDALGKLFVGWLGIKGLDALKAWQEGDTEALDTIKNQVLEGLAVAGAIAFALNGGIGIVLGALGGIVGLVLSSLPAIIGLAANPYVWLGAAVVIAGISLYNVFKDLFGTGRESFAVTGKNVIESIEKIGPEETKKELERQLKQIEDMPMGFQKALLYVQGVPQEIQKQIEFIDEGRYDAFIPDRTKPEDRIVLGQINAALGTLSGYVSAINDSKGAIAELLSGRSVNDLSSAEKKVYDNLMKTQQSMAERVTRALDFIKKLKGGLSEQGKTTLDDKIKQVSPGLLDKSLINFDIPFGPRISIGDYKVPELSNLEGLQKEIGGYVNPNKTSSGTMPTSTVTSPMTFQKSVNETKEAATQVNSNTAETVTEKSSSPVTVNVVPFMEEQPTSPPAGASSPNETEVPDIITSDSGNPYLDFSMAVYGVA